MSLSFEQIGEHIADDGTTRVSDMERTCRIGGDKLDVDTTPLCTVVRGLFFRREQRGEQALERVVRKRDVDEARFGDGAFLYAGVLVEQGLQALSEREGWHLAGFGKHEGCVRCEVEGGVWRRGIDGDALALFGGEGEFFVFEDLLDEAGAQGANDVQGGI